MKKIIFLSMAFAALTACSSDDSSTPVVTPPTIVNENPTILGAWKDLATKAVSGQDEWLERECDGISYMFIYTFNADGTFMVNQICEGVPFEDYSGTYALEGDVMILNTTDGPQSYKYSFEGNTILHMHHFVPMGNGDRFYSTLMNKLQKQ